MLTLDSHPAGLHFLQIPGPTNVPDRVLRAIDNVTIDHRGPKFAVLGKAALVNMLPDLHRFPVSTGPLCNQRGDFL